MLGFFMEVRDMPPAVDGEPGTYEAVFYNWVGGPTYKDLQPEAFTVHAPAAALGIGDPDTPDDLVELTEEVTAAAATGNFTALLDAPAQAGEHKLVARACLGPDSCALASDLDTIDE